MEISEVTTDSAKGGNNGRQDHRPDYQLESPAKPEEKYPTEASLAVGAKTLAGIGIGIICVIAATTVVGLAAEVVLIPSLLLKLAAGVAGGGLGMVKGLSDERKNREEA